MEEFVLDNGQLQVAVNPLGAEVTRITGKNGAQLMWEGTPSLWGHFSPLLFPFPGTLANGYYLSGGKKYPVPQGGFVKDSLFPSWNRTTIRRSCAFRCLWGDTRLR